MNTSPTDSQRSPLLRPFYPALDGLRAIAFLMVFCIHYGTGTMAIPYLSRIFDWGWVGVDIFFVLSGFLITGILFDSLHSEHFFKNFYLRRALRIFPLFYGLWLAALIATPLLHIEWNRYNAALAGYIGNFFIMGAMHHLHPNPGALSFPSLHPGRTDRGLVVGQLWSLCVEEQFYLLWPFVLWLVRSRRALLRISLTVVAAVPILRIAYAFNFPVDVAIGGLYFNSLFRVDSLLAGAALALWLRGPALPLTKIRFAASIAPVLAIGIFALGYWKFGAHTTAITSNSYNPFVGTVGYTLLAIIAGSVLLLAIDPTSWLARGLQQRPLLFLGRISYGLYVFHEIPVGFAVQAFLRLQPYHLQWLVFPAALLGTVAVAWLSFRFYETPFLRLKSVLAPQPAITPAPRAAIERTPVSYQPAHGKRSHDFGGIRPAA